MMIYSLLCFFLSQLLLVVCLMKVYLFFKKKYSYWKNRNVPFDEYSCPFGSIGKAVFMQTVLSRYLTKKYKQYTDYAYVGFYNFWSPGLLVRDLDLIKNVLMTDFNSFRDNWITVDCKTDPVMGKNLFPLPGDEWKVIRQQLAPQYSVTKFKQLIPMMEESGKTMLKYMHKRIEENKCNCLEVKELITRYTGDVVLMAAFGLEGKSFEVDTPVTFKIGQEIADTSILTGVKQTIGLFFPLLRRIFKLTFLGDPIPESFWRLVLDTIKYREQNNIVRKDYLDFIRELKKPGGSPYEITDAFAVAHSFTFFLDSLETSTIAMSSIMYELSVNPDVQEKARVEAKRILEKYKGTITYEAVAEMEYIDNVVSEGLRKHPVLAFLSRLCTEDYPFPSPGGPGTGKDIVIEKGTQVFISVYGIHHDPNYYPDPERFDPDRFTEEVKSSRPKMAFLGFGEGPRICLGKNYGILQIKVALALLLNDFEFRLNSQCKPLEQAKLHMLNVSKNDILVDFNRIPK